MLQHIGPRELIAALGLILLGIGLATIAPGVAMIVVGALLFCLAIPPRTFLR